MGREPAPITVRDLLLAAAVAAPASFLVRLVYPYGSVSGFTDLNLWEWPASIAVFVLGVAGSARGWVTAIPAGLHRRCRAASLSAVVAMAAFLAGTGRLGVTEQAMGGWRWEALVFAAVESVLTVFGSVWLVGVAQRRLDRRLWGPTVGRSAYAAFVVQLLVLVGLAVALRPVPLPAEAKALLVAGGGVAGSFAVARLLLGRLPGLARVL